MAKKSAKKKKAKKAAKRAARPAAAKKRGLKKAGKTAKKAAKKSVKGYPQDMWMTMDEMFRKPETYGLRAGWSGGMMGMMTLIRVLPEKEYDEMIARIKSGTTTDKKEHAHAS